MLRGRGIQRWRAAQGLGALSDMGSGKIVDKWSSYSRPGRRVKYNGRMT